MYRHIPTPEAQDTVKGSKVRTVFKWLLFAVTCFVALAYGGVIGFLLWSVFTLSAMGYYSKAPSGPRQAQRNYYAARYGPNPRVQAQAPTHDPLHPYDNL